MMSIEQEHDWAPPNDNDVSTCRGCDAKRRGEFLRFEYQQWWGGWHPLMEPPCASLERREELWKTEKQVVERRAAVGCVVNEIAHLRDVIRRALEAESWDAILGILRDEEAEAENTCDSWDKTLGIER